MVARVLLFRVCFCFSLTCSLTHSLTVFGLCLYFERALNNTGKISEKNCLERCTGQDWRRGKTFLFFSVLRCSCAVASLCVCLLPLCFWYGFWSNGDDDDDGDDDGDIIIVVVVAAVGATKPVTNVLYFRKHNVCFVLDDGAAAFAFLLSVCAYRYIRFLIGGWYWFRF